MPISLTEPFMEVLTALGIMGALWYGGHQVIAGTLTPGDFFMAAVALLYGPVRQPLPDRQHRPAVERVGRARLRDHRFTARHHRPARRRRARRFRRAIVFDRVASATPTPKTSTLRDISLTIARGEVVAFVGMSGAGKSTLMDLLPRFHDVSAGRITIDGHDLRDVTQPSLRA